MAWPGFHSLRAARRQQRRVLNATITSGAWPNHSTSFPGAQRWVPRKHLCCHGGIGPHRWLQSSLEVGWRQQGAPIVVGRMFEAVAVDLHRADGLHAGSGGKPWAFQRRMYMQGALLG